MASGLALAIYGLLLGVAAYLVWRRPVFALYAWIVGLAAHNSVMAALYGAGVRGHPLSVIQAWKELLLAVALPRVGRALRARRLAVHDPAARRARARLRAAGLLYAVLPQDWLGGSADRGAVGLALKHDLIPVAAYFLGRSVVTTPTEMARLGWTLSAPP